MAMNDSAANAGSTPGARIADAPKARWMVKLPGKTPFPMLGEPIDRAEALRCARLIWPNAEVE